MPNYAHTIIYKIVCKDVNVKEIYGGHTTNIIKRRQHHKSVCNNINNRNYNIYVYRFIRANGGFNNWDILWQYDFSCENKREAEFEERKFIENNKCELNSNRAFATKEEKKEYLKESKKKWYKININKIKIQLKDYYENNINKIKIYQKDYQKKKIKCECGCEILKRCLSIHKKTTKHIKLMEKLINEIII
jgi:hypothetical protein